MHALHKFRIRNNSSWKLDRHFLLGYTTKVENIVHFLPSWSFEKTFKYTRCINFEIFYLKAWSSFSLDFTYIAEVKKQEYRLFKKKKFLNTRAA